MNGNGSSYQILIIDQYNTIGCLLASVGLLNGHKVTHIVPFDNTDENREYSLYNRALQEIGGAERVLLFIPRQITESYIENPEGGAIAQIFNRIRKQLLPSYTSDNKHLVSRRVDNVPIIKSLRNYLESKGKDIFICDTSLRLQESPNASQGNIFDTRFDLSPMYGFEVFEGVYLQRLRRGLHDILSQAQRHFYPNETAEVEKNEDVTEITKHSENKKGKRELPPFADIASDCITYNPRDGNDMVAFQAYLTDIGINAPEPTQEVLTNEWKTS